MRWSHIVLVTCVAILFNFVQPADAAWRGYAVADVNMRSGPGVGYRVKAVVPRGARVRVRYCRRSWCNVRFRGIRGWVSRRYISRQGRRTYRRPRYRYRPPVYIYPPLYDEPYYDWPPVYNPPRIYAPRVQPRYRRYRGPRRYRRPGFRRPGYRGRPRYREPGRAGRPHGRRRGVRRGGGSRVPAPRGVEIIPPPILLEPGTPFSGK